MKRKILEIIRSIETFSAQDLIALFRGEILAIRIKGFCPPAVCEVINEKVLTHPQLEYYPHAPSIGRVMEALYESYQNPEKRAAYYQKAYASTLEFRRMSEPYLGPLDSLRLMLQDIWSAGAQRENIEGQFMAFSLAQIFKAGACALPHQDFLRMDEPDNAKAQSLITQATALIYTLPAKQGGLLELWREHFDGAEFQKRKNRNTYGLMYSKIPAPALRIKPEQGELVIADSTKVHAVTKVVSGPRIAVNCFIGFRGISEPLTFWT